MGHLALRFFGSLRPGGPKRAADAWALEQLLPGEQELWVRMSGPDRRHAVGVARDAIVDLTTSGAAPAAARPPVTRPPVTRAVVAAALLHDVGKVESGLGTWTRALVTIIALLVGRDRVASWPPTSGRTSGPAPAAGRLGRLRGRAGQYVTHDRIGADLLRIAGSDPLTVAWAAEHHLPEASWTIDRRTADALKAADGD
jgi:hypothetical protein